MRVLVIEDDKSVRETLTHVLESFGYSPFAATNTEDGLKIASSAKPQVVLLDLLLEGAIATPFIPTVRQMMNSEAPRIVVLSAMHGANKVAEANHAEFLSKPFDIDELRDVIDGKRKSPES